MTFDLDLWPTYLTINRDHLLIKDYLPTKFEASGAKRSWVISCTRWSKLAWLLTLTFDLLTWKSIGIIYSPRTIYLPSLKLLGQSVIELSVAQGKGLPTYRPTDRQVQSNMPSFFKGGHKDAPVTKVAHIFWWYHHNRKQSASAREHWCDVSCYIPYCHHSSNLSIRDHITMKDLFWTMYNVLNNLVHCFSSSTQKGPSQHFWHNFLKLLGQSVVELSVAQGLEDWHDLWPWPLTFDLLTWLLIGIIYSSRTIYLPSLKLQGQSVPELSVAQG